MKFTLRDELASKHLCASCMHGRVTTFASGGMETHCSAGAVDDHHVRDFVVSCSQHRFAFGYAPTRMEAMAWVIEKKRGRVTGFRPPKVEKGDDE